ncbi:MAG: glycosyltransferase family 2 protein [Cyanobacteria bacterium SZAS-4]|nr:glycosyltransferase family 2 protein [Cyanobacteria bacterium SZAS-4]
MPLVSVIIPCYNPNEYLTDAINSVLKQTLTDFEVVVVDDGSQVDVENLIPRDSRVTYSRQGHNGVAISRNLGFSLTTGDYVAFLDADDLWQPTKLDRQVTLLREHPSMGFCYTNVLTLDERTGNNRAEILNKGDVDIDFSKPALDVIHQCNICTSTVMIKRDSLNACGWFDPLLSYSEDYDLFLRLARFFPQMGYLATPEVSYRIWDASVSSRYKNAFKFGSLTMERHARFGKRVDDVALVRAAEGLQERLSKFCAARAYDNCRVRFRQRELIGFLQEFYSAFQLSPDVIFAGLSSWLDKRLARGSATSGQ